MSICVVGSNINCFDQTLSGNCDSELRLSTFEQAERGAQLAGRAGAFCCKNPADEEALRGPRRKRPIPSSPTTRRQSECASNDVVARKINLGLPPLDRDYEQAPRERIEEEVGFGFGIVKYFHKVTSMPRAVITIRKAAIPLDVSAADLERQLELLCRLDHPNIVLLRECCEDLEHLKLVYDWCDGGTLMHQMWRFSDVLTEGHIAQVVREMLSALGAAHNLGVQHLDLGLFSLFLQQPDHLSPVKIFGFGLAGFLIPPVSKRKVSCTNKHCFAAPELFAVRRVQAMTPPTRHSCDIWSVGALLYTLISGHPPFGLGSIEDLSDRTQHNAWSFGIEFSQYSSSVRDFVQKALCVPWTRRPNAGVSLNHPWLSGKSFSNLKDCRVSQKAVQQLNAYARTDHAKQMLAQMMTDIGLTTDAYSDLERKFREIDLNGDGTITLDELSEVSSSIPGMSQVELSAMVTKLDRNGNHNVDISEFIAGLVMEQEQADERIIRQAFTKMDINRDGRLTRGEVYHALREYSGSLDAAEVNDFICHADIDGDQTLDFNEYRCLFKHVKDRSAEMARKMQEAASLIQLAPQHLKCYHQRLQSWMQQLEVQRDRIEIACGAQQTDVHVTAQSHYSYEEGHISEYDVRLMVQDMLQVLRDVPERNSSQKAVGRSPRKSPPKSSIKDRKPMKSEQVVSGLVILSRAANRPHSSPQHSPQRSPQSSPLPSPGRCCHAANGRSSSPENESRFGSFVGSTALEEWQTRMQQERRQRLQCPDSSHAPEYYLVDSLYWLIRVKSEFHWQRPLIAMARQLVDAAVEDTVEVCIRKRRDWDKLVHALDALNSIREPTAFGDVDLKAGAQLLPCGAFQGKNLKALTQAEIQEMKLPAQCFFRVMRTNVTKEKIYDMRSLYLLNMRSAGQHIRQILQELQQLFHEVSEDFQISSTMEARMPSLPHTSAGSLKRRVRFDIACDAHTPWTDEEELDGEAVSGSSSTLAASKSSSCSRAARRIERTEVLKRQVAKCRSAQANRIQMARSKRCA